MKTDDYCLLIGGIIFLILMTGCTNIQVGSPGSTAEVITVGATTQNDTIADFSSRGPTIDKITKPDIVAPGVDIIGAKASGTTGFDSNVGDYYTVASGTSMSTPIVAGSAALLIQIYKEKFGRKPNPAEIKAALMLGTNRINDKFGEEYDSFHQGTGRLNLSNSYKILTNQTTLLAANPPKWSASKSTSEMSRYTGRSEPMLLYALLPGDSAKRKFTLIIGQNFSSLNVNPGGGIRDWIEINSNRSYFNIAENNHEIIDATISIPAGTGPGRYSGGIEISNETSRLIEIPVDVLVLNQTEFSNGNIFVEKNITINNTEYASFSIPRSTYSILKINTVWDENRSSDFASYLVDPNGLVNYISYFYQNSYANESFESNASLILKEAFRGNYTLVLWSPNQTATANISLIALNIVPSIQKEISLRENQNDSGTITINNLGMALNNIQILAYIEKERPEITTEFYKNLSSINHTFYIDSKAQRFSLIINITSTNPDCHISGELYSPSNAIVDSFSWIECNITQDMSVQLPDTGNWRLSLITDDLSNRVNADIENLLYFYEEYSSIKFSQNDVNLTNNSSLTIDYTAEYNKNFSGRNIGAFIGLFSDEARISIPLTIVQPLNLSSAKSIKPFRDGFLTGNIDIPEGNWVLRFGINSSLPSKLQFIGQSGIESAFSDGGYVEILLEYSEFFSGYTGKLENTAILADYEITGISIDINGDGNFSGIYEKPFLDGEILNLSGNLYNIESIYYDSEKDVAILKFFKFLKNQDFNLNVAGGKNWNIKILGKEFPNRIDTSKIELSNSTTDLDGSIYNTRNGALNIDKQNIMKFYIIAENPTNYTINPLILIGEYPILPYIEGNELYKEEIPISYLNEKTEIIVILDPGYNEQIYPELYYKAVYSAEEIDANISYSLISRDKPDLAITGKDIVFDNYWPTEGENLTINATISNVGLRNASNILVQFFDGNREKNGTQINSDKIIDKINSGENSTLSAVWNSTGGNHDIYVIIDPKNDVDELEETNNQAYSTIYVEYKKCPLKGDTPHCDGKIDDFELLTYINLWGLGDIDDFALLEAVNNWKNSI